MQVKVVYKGAFELPKHETELSAGLDIRADFSKVASREDVLVYDGAYASGNWDKEQLINLPPHSRVLIPTNIFMELPKGYEAQIRPRSGIALKNGISIMNSPGTIDADYRGEVRIIVTNQSLQPFVINHGDKICQMVVAKHERVEWDVQEDLSNTERGEGGFGHTTKRDEIKEDKVLDSNPISEVVITDETKLDQTSKATQKAKKNDSNK